MVADNNKTIENLSESLFEAEINRRPIGPLTVLNPDLTIDDSYAIQICNINQKVEIGHRIIGKKIGLTSLAMQQMLNVDQPDFGHLLDNMQVSENEISMSRVLQPKVEAEIAFVLKKDLKGPKVSTLDVLLATDYVVAALEIVDSRIENWQIKLTDTIADNASSGLFVLGNKKVRIDELDLTQVGMALYKNGELVNTGIGAAALGNPAVCVAWLANKLADYGVFLKQGEIILSGALSAAVPAAENDSFKACFSKLGEVSVAFK